MTVTIKLRGLWSENKKRKMFLQLTSRVQHKTIVIIRQQFPIIIDQWVLLDLKFQKVLSALSQNWLSLIRVLRPSTVSAISATTGARVKMSRLLNRAQRCPNSLKNRALNQKQKRSLPLWVELLMLSQLWPLPDLRPLRVSLSLTFLHLREQRT
jgi:hypothetical protein